MGTVIFPNAQLKVFLTASTETRAKRRYQQLIGKNQAANYESILQDLQERDARDKGRASAPLSMANDAILLETDNLTISQAVVCFAKLSAFYTIISIKFANSLLFFNVLVIIPFFEFSNFFTSAHPNDSRFF